MRYRGENKIYFEIGIRPDQRRMNAVEIYFSWFKLIKRNIRGEALQRGINYKGFILFKTIKIPDFGYEWKKKEKEKYFFDIMKVQRDAIIKSLGERLKKTKIYFDNKDMTV